MDGWAHTPLYVYRNLSLFKIGVHYLDFGLVNPYMNLGGFQQISVVAKWQLILSNLGITTN